MFPVVPLGFSDSNFVMSSAGHVLSYATGSSKLLVPGRVTACTNIPQGSVSAPIDPNCLIKQPDVAQISVGINPLGTISPNKSSSENWFKNIHWIRALRLSEDCHSYNVLLCLQSTEKQCDEFTSTALKPKLILRSTKAVEQGQELLMWFSEDILAMLQVAFLTPANIQGQRKYVCNKCFAMYESPNPLKLHITLNCERYPISTLWERLASYLIQDNSTSTYKGFSFSLLTELTPPKQRKAMDLTTDTRTSNEPENNILFRPYSQTSAFKPFRKQAPQEDNNVYLSPLLGYSDKKYDEAHMESLVSGLGKSKQGHFCLYCGKCYSRKYGLKIHIRTHTGYKPLKCKYCLRPFGDPSNLNKHVRLHAEGDTPYKCDLCGKVLVRRRDLERHLKSRHISEMHPNTNLLTDTNSEKSSEEEEEEQESTKPS